MIIQNKQPEIYETDGTAYWRKAWLAAHNPIRFEWQRKDYVVVDVQMAGPTDPFVLVKVNGVIPYPAGQTASAIDSGLEMYINTPLYKGSFKVFQYVQALPFTIVKLYTPFVGADLIGGYLNDNMNRENYYLKTTINYFDWTTTTYKVLDSRKFTPDLSGLLKADVSSPVKSKVSCESDQLYNTFTHFDKKATCIFRVDYQEVWSGSNETVTLGQVDYFATTSARQILTKNGSNLAEYVPTALAGLPCKFITSFHRPYYFNGFPYDIGFIYSEHVKGINMTLEQDELNHNKSGIGNKQDQVAMSGYPCEARLKLRGVPSYSAGTKYLDIYLKANSIVQETYVEGGYVDPDYYEAIPPAPPSLTPFNLSETKRIEIVNECFNNPVYLRWKSTAGGWDYWLFHETQKNDPQVKDGDDYERYESDLATSSGKREMLYKTSVPQMVAGANGVDMLNVSGFVSLLESVRVQMLMNPSTWVTEGPKWQTVFISGKLPTDTRASRFDIELTITSQERNLISQ